MIASGIETFASGIGAVALWWVASRVDVPPFPDVGFDSDSSVFEPVRQALGRSSRLNAQAAIASAIAAVAACAAFLAHLAQAQ